MMEKIVEFLVEGDCTITGTLINALHLISIHAQLHNVYLRYDDLLDRSDLL